jgi:alpha-mannosidase
MGGETFKEEKLKSSYPTRAAKPVGALIPDIYKNRLEMFYSGGQYESKNLKAYATHDLCASHSD